MDQTTEKLNQVTEQLSQDDIYNPENQDKLQKLLEQSTQLKAELDEYEMEWLELSE